MRPTHRYQVIQALGQFFLPLSESEADAILNMARAGVSTPSGWGGWPQGNKLQGIVKTLSQAPDEALEGLNELLPENEQVSLPAELRIPEGHASNLPSIGEAKRTFDGPIFVVHGHSRAVLHEVVRVLERGTGREVIVLHEQANAGRTILEKFEDHAADASFAVVLLTGDDEGGTKTSAAKQPRGRQNVIFELGFFFGKLGRHRVVVLLEDSVEKPSDIDGLVYVDLDQAGAWKQELARELEAADISVDRSRIP